MSKAFIQHHGAGAGFTLIELLVVISIIAILIGLSVFGLQGARQSARDSQRKADLEKIRSGLEIYKSDCNDYPASGSIIGGSDLVGDGSPASCASANKYISSVPKDPLDPTRAYRYVQLTTNTYELCASLEQGTGSVSGCSGGCGTTCNYKVVNP